MICANPLCAKEFTPRTSIQRCCSDRCGKRVRWHRGDAKRKDDPDRVAYQAAYRLAHPEKFTKKSASLFVPSSMQCPTCGGSFVTQWRGQLYCSTPCSETASRKRRWGRFIALVQAGDPVAVAKHERRKAKIRDYLRKYGTDRYTRVRQGVETERVDAVAVFERDGWRCQICGRPTPKAKRGTMADNAPELEHRVPLKLGGAHTYANTQCACRRCNRSKGARRIVGQLPMFINPASVVPT